METSLILELQKHAMDQGFNILDLLSRAYVVARKLRIDSFVDWIEKEQKGYSKETEVPPYRRIATYLHYRNPYNGWQPVVLQSKKEQLFYASFPVTDSIPSISDLLKSSGAFSCYLLSDDMNVKYSKSLRHIGDLGVVFQFALYTPRNAMANIIQQVRNKILDWSLLLEENGILGEGMSFSEKELANAKTNSIINYTINIYGNAENTQIQQKG